MTMGRRTLAERHGLTVSYAETPDGWAVVVSDNETIVYERSKVSSYKAARNGVHKFVAGHYGVDPSEPKQESAGPLPASAKQLVLEIRRRAEANERQAMQLRLAADALEVEAKRFTAAADTMDPDAVYADA